MKKILATFQIFIGFFLITCSLFLAKASPILLLLAILGFFPFKSGLRKWHEKKPINTIEKYIELPLSSLGFIAIIYIFIAIYFFSSSIEK